MPIVTISAKGQIAIPRQIRERLRLEEGAKVQVDVQDGVVILRPIKPAASGWRRWQGVLAGQGVLKALREDHAREIARDE